ncbi:MAG: FtsX-like permease family protein [Pseudomonadales bacterium]|nr:FtsX-like permease family protein [Pseudomonadales bacterium]
MFANYFAASIRYLSKNRLYGVINVVGLSISLAACMLITVYVQGELSYDQSWQNAEQIYRANFITKRPGRPPQPYPISSEIMLPAMQQFFPNEIELGARIYQGGPAQIQIEDARYSDPIRFVDEDMISIFQFETLYGDLQSAFADLNSIAISEESALRYFGSTNVVGETLSGVLFDGELEAYEVVAVFRFPEENTVLELPNMALYDQEKISRGNNTFQSWLRISVQTYLKLSPGTNIDAFHNRLPEMLDLYASLPQSRLSAGQTPSDVIGIELQNIGEIYFNPIGFINLDQESGNETMVIVFMLISVLVVLVGCINFVVLATALAERRRMDVAMRKVHGASPGQLLSQYLGESLMLTLLSFLLAAAAVVLLLPFLESILVKELSLALSSITTWVYLFVLFTLVGVMGCFYPAFILSHQLPVQALRANTPRSGQNFFSVRNFLVVFQFSISIVLIIATLTIYGQLYYTARLDPGFNSNNVITIPGFGQEQISGSKEVFKQEALRLPEVTSASYSATGPNNGLGLILDYNAIDGVGGTRDQAISTLFMGYDFFDTFEISLVAGRFPERGRDSEEQLLFMLAVAGEEDTAGMNQQPATILTDVIAAQRLGFANPSDAVGAIIETGTPDEPGFQEFQIIGVVADSQYRSLRQTPEGEIFYLYEESSDVLNLRFEGDPQAALENITEVWSTVVGEQIFPAAFLEENLADTFLQERNDGLLLVSFSLLSLIVACLGLFGIATFNVERRARETGLRKVLGADTRDIITLLLWQFSKPVLVANCIAWPAGVWGVLIWLDRFPYPFDSWFLIPICAVAGLMAMLIAWSTVIMKTRLVANASPMQFLRWE